MAPPPRSPLRTSPRLLASTAGWSRRDLIRTVGAATVVAGAGAGGLLLPRRGYGGTEPRLLITIGCFGGASMLDCMMPVDSGEALSLSGRGTVISYPTVTPAGSNIRCVSRDLPVAFLEKYAAHTVVMGAQASSVNHFTAQARAVNGRSAFAGRTLAEALAAAYGETLVLPNVNMGRGGYAEPGLDVTLPSRYRAEIVANPVTFPFSTSGWRGTLPTGTEVAAMDPDLLEVFVREARAVRDGALESASPFGQTFASSRPRAALLSARASAARSLEVDDLIQQLLFVPDLGDALPLHDYGLSPSAESDAILDLLPDAFPADTSGTPRDRLQAQAALAYLLLRTGTACAVTLTDPGTDGFLAFDQSHQSHLSAQQVHWDRALDIADRLIQLLSAAPDASGNGTLWDRTLILFATEFGRDKWNTGGTFGTGHHLNNGVLLVSPLLRGNQSLGQPDPHNGFICGFDPDSGTPTPFDDLSPGEDPLFTDTRLPPGEEAIYGTVLAALGVSFEGQQTLPVALPA